MLENNRKDEMGSVKIIAPIVGFTSDVETLDFGEFVICKVRSENLGNFLRSMRITKEISFEIAAQLLSNYLLCYEYSVEDGEMNPSDKTWMRIENLVKTFRLYKSGNVRNYFHIIVPSTGGYMYTGYVKGGFLNYHFSSSEIEDFLEFQEILTTLIPNELDKNNRYIEIAIRYFNFANERDSNEDKMVDYIIALEALYLNGDHGEFTYRLAHRAASMLGSTFDKRRETFRNVRDAYDLRSQIVHGGSDPKKRKITNEDVEKVNNYVRMSIVAYLNLNKTHNSQKLILEKIDESLFGEASWDTLQKDAKAFLACRA
jgi:hypothetical protein